MKVKEIMTRDVVSVSADMSVDEALHLIFKMKISGLPVIDEKNNLIGMFTEKGILRTILPGYLDKVGGFVYEENPKVIKKKMSELTNMKVSQVMRQEVITVNEDTTLCEVARIMLTQHIRRILVLQSDNKVVGIVAREDVLRAFAKEAGLA